MLIKCALCGKKMTREAWEQHARKCAPKPRAGESFEEYKRRVNKERKS